MKKLFLLVPMLLAGCATVQTNYTPFACTTLIPEKWAERIAGEPLPDLLFLRDLENSPDIEKRLLAAKLETREYQKAYVGAGFRQSMVASRSEDQITIVKNCEKNQAEAVKKIQKKWYEVWK